MQPELQTDFPMIAHQPGNTTIGSKVGSLKRNNEVKSQDKCFLGMLNDIEKTPHENIIDLKELQEKSINSVPVVVIKPEQEISNLIGEMALKGENISAILLEPEYNSNGNNEKQFIPVIAGTDLLKGQTNGNGTDKNTIATALKTETESGLKKSASGEMLKIPGMTVDDESNTWQGKLNKNNTRFQISNGIKPDVGNEAKAQLLNGLEAEIAKMIKDTGTSGKTADGQNRSAEAGTQLLKGMGVEISKLIKNLETTDKNEKAQMKNTSDIKDLKKTAATDRILMESPALRENVEELKIVNPPQIPTGIQEKEQESDLSKRDNTPDKKASQSDKEFINLKEAGLKVKVSGSEFSGGKIIGGEPESKDNGILLAKSGTGDKGFEEVMFSRENRLSSTISRTGTLNQIVEKAALSLKNGKSQARIELKPDFLGSVRMKITTENHLVRVRILTELPIVKEMIESNISQLKTDLQSQGLTIDKLDVSVANDSQQRGKGFEEAGLLSEKENSDFSDNKTVVEKETETANLLKESTAEYGLDFFA